MTAVRPFVFRSALPTFVSMLALAGCIVVEGEEPTSSSTGSSSSGTSTSGTSSSSSSSGSGGAGGHDGFRVSGTLMYENVPYNVALDGLDYTKIEQHPIRGVSVRLLDAATNVEIAKTLSDDNGAYAFDYAETAKVKLWVYAETEVPVIKVEDNTDGDALYLIESTEVDSAADAKIDVLAKTGWDGTSYSATRAAAPFAALDIAYLAARRFLDEVTPPPVFPPLLVKWSVNNRPESGDKTQGQIETSHYDKKALYILGKEDVDTDEFDGHIIVHEWGHAFEDRIGRSDSIGGSHSGGDVKDPRIAWSEGSCNALSAIILDPDWVYTDSTGPQQSGGFTNDIEANLTTIESAPGWFSESSVQGIVFDLYDAANEPSDKVNGGLDVYYDAMIGQRDKPSLTTLFSFVAALKENSPALAANTDTITNAYNLNASFGISPIQDEWGTGETHSGGFAGSVPVYKTIAIGNFDTVDMKGDEYNGLGQNVYVKIVGDGAPVTVTSTSANDVDLQVYRIGVLVVEATTTSGDETVTFDTVAGDTYVMTVHGYDNLAMSFSVDIAVSH